MGTRTPVAAARSGRCLGVLFIAGGIAGAFTTAVLIGRAQDARAERILGIFDPLFLWLREDGAHTTDWLDAHAAVVAAFLTIGLALVATAGWRTPARRAAPLLAACAAVALATWGQALLLHDYVVAGTAAYLSAVAAAVGLGWWHPMRRLSGFPPFGAEAGAGMHGAWQPAWWLECVLVLAIAILALVCRVWALTELSDFLDLEMVDSMAQSRTLHGAANYARYTFLTTNPGAAHILPQWVIYNLFGASIFTLRMAPVLWGVATVPVMYWLVRRLAGPAPALIAALLLATAADQLFWSRSENGFFAAVGMLGLVTVLVGLWMVERFSVAAVVAAAICMPLSRYFYTTCLAMFLFPLALAGHAMLCIRGAWRRLWVVAPGLALGLIAWWVHLSVLMAALNNWQWKFEHPAKIYGGTAWTRQGDFANAPLLELVHLQAVSMAERLAGVVRDLTYHAVNCFGHWYSRASPGPHPTTMNVGLVALLALGIGYLAGQLRDPRAFALLVWLALSLLGGIMSNEPTPRRMSMLFPATHVIAAVFVAAFVRIARQAGGPRSGQLAAGLTVAALAVVMVTNSVSHFRLPVQPVLFGDYLRFLRPTVEQSDALFLNLPAAFRSFVVLGNLEHMLRSPGCVEHVESHRQWLHTALAPTCRFADATYHLTMTNAERAALQARYRMRRPSFVFFVDPTSQADLDLIRALYPEALVREYTSPRDQRQIATVTIDVEASHALRTPELRMPDPPDPAPALLAGVPLKPVDDAALGAAVAAVVAGGIAIETDGWYRFDLQPACPAAELRVDGRPASGAGLVPMLAGVHAFTIALSDLTRCRTPMQIVAVQAGSATPTAVPPERITSPQIAALPQAAAPAVEVYDGYAPPVSLATLPMHPGDLAVGPDGTLYLAGAALGKWHMYRLTPGGRIVTSWDLPAPRGINLSTIAVAPDGTVAALFARTVMLYSASGQPLGQWENSWLGWESQLAWWGDDLLLATIIHRNSIAVFNRRGELLREFSSFNTDHGPAELYQPQGFSLSPTGDLVVLQPNGEALLFHTPTDDFQPTFVRRFASEAGSHGAAFDGSARILLPVAGAVQVFDPSGTRLLAADPTRDPGRQPFGHGVRLRGAADGVYVLAAEGNRLWKISH